MNLRTKVNDCEFDKMGDDKAIKSVITLNTHSEKLQSSIIQKNMSVSKLVSTARSLELAKTILSTSRLIPLEQIPYVTMEDVTTTHKEERILRNQQRKISKFVSTFGRKYHM